MATDWADDTYDPQIVPSGVDWPDDQRPPNAASLPVPAGATDWADDTAPPLSVFASVLPVGTFDFADDTHTPPRRSAVVASDWEDHAPWPWPAGAPAAVGVNNAGNNGYGMAVDIPAGVNTIYLRARVGFTGIETASAALFGGLFYGYKLVIGGLPVYTGATQPPLGQEFIDWPTASDPPAVAWADDERTNTWTDSGAPVSSTWYTYEHSFAATATVVQVGLQDFQQVDEDFRIDGTDFGPGTGWPNIGLHPQAAKNFKAVTVEVIGLDPTQTIYLASLKIGTTGFGSTDILSYDAATDTIASKFTWVDAGSPGWTDGTAPF